MKILLLATAVAVVLAARAGALDGLGPALLLVGAGSVLLWAFGPSATTGRSSAGRSVAIHGHAHGDGARREVAVHEAGHVAGARAVGGRVRSATVSADGRTGLVQAVVPDARAALVFLRAGQYAAGTSRGAGADDAEYRKTLREFPAGERRQVQREADREARRVVSRGRRQIHRDAARLDERGRL